MFDDSGPTRVTSAPQVEPAVTPAREHTVCKTQSGSDSDVAIHTPGNTPTKTTPTAKELVTPHKNDFCNRREPNETPIPENDDNSSNDGLPTLGPLTLGTPSVGTPSGDKPSDGELLDGELSDGEILDGEPFDLGQLLDGGPSDGKLLDSEFFDDEPSDGPPAPPSDGTSSDGKPAGDTPADGPPSQAPSIHTKTNDADTGNPAKVAQPAATNDPTPAPAAANNPTFAATNNRTAAAMANNFIPTNQQRNMRACMVCSIIKTQQQFLNQGCPNCAFLELRGNADAIADCTSQVFEGLIAIGSTTKSWVARWQRLDGYVPGCYAVQVEGILPDEVISTAEENGVHYIPRDGSVNEALPTDG